MRAGAFSDAPGPPVVFDGALFVVPGAPDPEAPGLELPGDDPDCANADAENASASAAVRAKIDLCFIR